MPKRVVELRKWGHSRAMIVPKDILEQLKLNVGDMLVVSVERDALVFRPMQLVMRGDNSGVTDVAAKGDAAK